MRYVRFIHTVHILGKPKRPTLDGSSKSHPCLLRHVRTRQVFGNACCRWQFPRPSLPKVFKSAKKKVLFSFDRLRQLDCIPIELVFCFPPLPYPSIARYYCGPTRNEITKRILKRLFATRQMNMVILHCAVSPFSISPEDIHDRSISKAFRTSRFRGSAIESK